MVECLSRISLRDNKKPGVQIPPGADFKISRANCPPRLYIEDNTKKAMEASYLHDGKYLVNIILNKVYYWLQLA